MLILIREIKNCRLKRRRTAPVLAEASLIGEEQRGDALSPRALREAAHERAGQLHQLHIDGERGARRGVTGQLRQGLRHRRVRPQARLQRRHGV